MHRGKEGKGETGQRLGGCHSLLCRHDLSNHCVVSLDGHDLPPRCNPVKDFACVSGQLSSSDGLHGFTLDVYALIRIVRKLCIHDDASGAAGQLCPTPRKGQTRDLLPVVQGRAGRSILKAMLIPTADLKAGDPKLEGHILDENFPAGLLANTDRLDHPGFRQISLQTVGNACTVRHSKFG